MSARTAVALGLRVAAACGAIGLIAGCGAEPPADIKADLAASARDARGRIDKLPEVRPYAPPELQVQRDPFSRR